ncbi:hypothetical protein M0811_01837 [Anaeramoeba ignava]|uniref:Tyr recombinase domain-containing protein n=1 Tax=Anaeramoeba ignava TaxID=1746090 RepID=A0A9Q0R8L4_ANAIG|nr:hypothetical protein M0811_01837 [Anaeramoeba ignava]
MSEQISLEKPSENQRFREVSDQEIEHAQTNATPSNTNRSTDTWIKVWEQYAKQFELPMDFSLLDSETLQMHLSKLILQLKTQDEQEYSSSSIYYCAAGWNRFLKEHDFKAKRPERSLLQGREFWKFQNILHYKMKILDDLGKGEKKHYEPVTLEEFQALKATFNISEPRGLIGTLILQFGIFCAFRGGDYWRLKMGNVTLKKDQQEYFEIRLFREKNNQRGLKGKHQKSRVTYIMDPLAVQNLKNYLAQRLPQNNERFFLGINGSKKRVHPFKNQAMGKNTLRKILQEACKKAKIQKKITLHSLRTTCITWLNKMAESTSRIQLLSGHKCIDSVQNYNHAQEDIKKELANKLTDLITPAESTKQISEQTKDNSEQTKDNSEQTKDNSEQTKDNSEQTKDNSEQTKEKLSLHSRKHSNPEFKKKDDHSLAISQTDLTLDSLGTIFSRCHIRNSDLKIFLFSYTRLRLVGKIVYCPRLRLGAINGEKFFRQCYKFLIFIFRNQ